MRDKNSVYSYLNLPGYKEATDEQYKSLNTPKEGHELSVRQSIIDKEEEIKTREL